MTDDALGDLKVVKGQFVKFGKVGDWIRGTLVAVREMDSQLKPGEKVKLYDFKAHGGRFWGFKKNPETGAIDFDAAQTELAKGSFWTMSGKPGIDNGMRAIKVGQIFGARFASSKAPTKAGNSATKVIEILAGGNDPEYQGETAADLPL